MSRQGSRRVLIQKPKEPEQNQPIQNPGGGTIIGGENPGGNLGGG